MIPLSDELLGRIESLCQEGDTLAGEGSYAAALQRYGAAWELLPEPRTQWQVATWLLAAIGDVNFLDGDYPAGRDNLSLAMHCPEAIGNPFLHMRLGQCQYELGNTDQAADELVRAYMGGGGEIFEKEHPKYFAFLKTRIKLPPGGW